MTATEHSTPSRFLQCSDLFAGLHENPLADRHDEAGLFGEGYEGVWADQAELRAVPAKQGLHAEHSAVGKGYLRLIENLELLIFKRGAQGRIPSAVAASLAMPIPGV